MSESRTDRFVAEALNLAVSDEFYDAYRAQMIADQDHLRSLLAELAGEGNEKILAPAERASGVLSKVELERMLREMRRERRVSLARLVAGEWW